MLGGEVVFNDRYAWEGSDYAPLVERAPLVRYALDGALEYWSADLALSPPRLRYRFGLDTTLGRCWFGWDGLRDVPAPRGAFEFAYVREGDVPASPDWARGATFYHVFPERFARGSTTSPGKRVAAWDAPVARDSFLGGDLDGVTEHLDHIAALSTDAVYLTPIFESPSNHKYDTSDYFTVDRDFGGNAALRRLVGAAHQRGIRVILDGVFNHAGAEWPPFVDARRRGPESPYRDWFYWRDGSDAAALDYETWATNVASMPKLRTSEPAVRELVCRIGRFWVEEFGVDGWRLDVANEVDHSLWRAFRRSVRSANDDAFLVGEVWDWAMPWLRGDEFDSTMNYPLGSAILRFAKGDAGGATFLDAVDRVRAAYPEPVHHLLYNLIGSHDEDRPLTVVSDDKRRLALAVAVLYALPGIVSVYYGDEVGMSGRHDDHGNRGGMIWDVAKQDRRLLDIHRALGRLRRNRHELKLGAYRRLASAGQSVAFARESPAGLVVVVANAGDAEAAINESDVSDWIGGRAHVVSRISYDDPSEGASTRASTRSLRLAPWSVTLLARAETGAQKGP